MGEIQPKISQQELPALLKENAPRLREYVEARIPIRLRTIISVDDIIQETWMDAFRCVLGVSLKGPGALDRWLTTMARRKLINAIVAIQRVKRGGAQAIRVKIAERPSSFVDRFITVASQGRTPSSEAAVSEAATAIRIALSGLSENHRRAIHLRYIDGHTPDKVAEIMKKPVSTVRGLIFRGLRQLQTELGQASKFWSDTPGGNVGN